MPDDPSQQVIAALADLSGTLSDLTNDISSLLTKNGTLNPSLDEVLAATIDVENNGQQALNQSPATIGESRSAWDSARQLTGAVAIRYHDVETIFDPVFLQQRLGLAALLSAAIGQGGPIQAIGNIRLLTGRSAAPTPCADFDLDQFGVAADITLNLFGSATAATLDFPLALTFDQGTARLLRVRSARICKDGVLLDSPLRTAIEGIINTRVDAVLPTVSVPSLTLPIPTTATRNVCARVDNQISVFGVTDQPGGILVPNDPPLPLNPLWHDGAHVAIKFKASFISDLVSTSVQQYLTPDPSYDINGPYLRNYPGPAWPAEQPYQLGGGLMTILWIIYYRQAVADGKEVYPFPVYLMVFFTITQGNTGKQITICPALGDPHDTNITVIDRFKRVVPLDPTVTAVWVDVFDQAVQISLQYGNI